MEKEILKFILSNQGAVNTEELVTNLGDASTLSEILYKNEKLVSCEFYRQPKVVARTIVSLCRPKDCEGCGRLHLCKNVLYTGSCHFTQSRRGCTFSHDLHSDHNLKILKELELETLSRTELCILLLQSDNTLLPSVCHNYNNTSGCQDDCPRLHICERFLGRGCSCFRNHNFFAPQPLKRLREKHIPDNLFPILKSVYANKAALRFADKAAERGNSSNRENRGSRGNNPRAGRTLSHSDVSDDLTSETSHAGYDSDSSSDISTNQNKNVRGGYNGRGSRGNGGNRGNRGNRGNWDNRGNWGSRGNRCSGGNGGSRVSNPQAEETFSYRDSQAATSTDYLNSEPNDSSQDPKPTVETSIFDGDSSSDNSIE